MNMDMCLLLHLQDTVGLCPHDSYEDVSCAAWEHNTIDKVADDDKCVMIALVSLEPDTESRVCVKGGGYGR